MMFGQNLNLNLGRDPQKIPMSVATMSQSVEEKSIS